jgi:23S rRNA pseudouridine1911/1915/1917 synthase
VSAPVRWPELRLVVEAIDAGTRLDRFLASRLTAFSREQARVVMREGRVRVDTRVERTGVTLAAGSVVAIAGVPPPSEPVPVANPDLPLVVVLEREGVLALDKPAGLPTLPLAPDDVDNLASALVARYPRCRGVGPAPLEAGLLHRLDNETSGLVLAASSAEAYRMLSTELERGEVVKTYLALVEGTPPAEGTVAWPLTHATDRRRMRAVRPGDPAGGGRPAETRYRVRERREGRALVEVVIRTGARHQIRAHLAELGHPLAGDVLYGATAGPLPRHFLHATALELTLPESGERVRIESALPPDLVDWMNLFKRLA